MFASIGRDLFLSSLAQEAQEITQLPESICRQAVIAAVEQLALPLDEAGKQLVSGLREQETTSHIVALFWQEVQRLRSRKEMACYSVYHARDPMQMVYHDEAQWYQDRESHYQHVADVEASVEEKPLEQVFALTNHTECNWTANAAVVWHDTTMPLRSTSVGDIVTCTSTGQSWMIMAYGFKPL